MPRVEAIGRSFTLKRLTIFSWNPRIASREARVGALPQLICNLQRKKKKKRQNQKSIPATIRNSNDNVIFEFAA
jgi:hypothetical protein